VLDDEALLGATMAAASTSLRPSQMLWQTGFSTYTCLPLAMAVMAMSVWLWFGVAMVMASISWIGAALTEVACRPSP
jgi:hypothetical protein